MNRVIDRDPISGRGLSARETDPERVRRTRTAHDDRNPILGSGNLGKEVRMFSSLPNGPKRTGRESSRNPLNVSWEGSDGCPPDDLRPNGRPGKARAELVNRDPIAGSGEFGVEWDPVHHYAGRRKQLLGLTSEEWNESRTNPLTGEGVDSFEINRELRPAASRKMSSDEVFSNPLTGENCQSYIVSDKLNEKHLKSGSRFSPGGNPLTGENCRTSEKQKSALPRQQGPPSNPLTGENCIQSSDFRKKFAPNAAEFTRNPVTGQNCQGFTVSVEEKPRSLPADSGDSVRCNPVTGEGCQSYLLSPGEKLMEPSSPRAASGNPVTGENVATFDVHSEQRVKRREAPESETNGII